MTKHDNRLAEVGTRIKLARERKGWTQRALGRMLGVSFQMVQNYEHGKLTLERARTIALYLGVDPDWLLMGDGGPQPQQHSIPAAQLGFYGRPANSTAEVDMDVLAKAACGLPADAPTHLAWQHWFKRIHADDHARVKAELARLDREGIFETQYTIVGRDGAERCIIDYGRMIADAAGRPTRLQGMMLDITHMPRTAGTENRIRIILAAVRSVLVVLAAVVLTCAAVCEIYGLPCPWLMALRQL